jgi:hypothetical protein
LDVKYFLKNIFGIFLCLMQLKMMVYEKYFLKNLTNPDSSEIGQNLASTAEIWLVSPKAKHTGLDFSETSRNPVGL